MIFNVFLWSHTLSSENAISYSTYNERCYLSVVTALWFSHIEDHANANNVSIISTSMPSQTFLSYKIGKGHDI